MTEEMIKKAAIEIAIFAADFKNDEMLDHPNAGRAFVMSAHTFGRIIESATRGKRIKEDDIDEITSLADDHMIGFSLVWEENDLFLYRE